MAKRNTVDAEYERLARLPTAQLDKMAFGFNDGDVLVLEPGKVRSRYEADVANAERKFKLGGMAWARSVDLSTPVEVSFDGKRFWLEDGHHRRLAARKTKRTLLAVVAVKANPIKALLGIA